MPESLDTKMQDFLSNLVSSKHLTLLEMLTEDAVIEFPYHPPTMPSQVTGKQQIERHFASLVDIVSINEIRLVATHQTTNPNVAVLEYEGEGKAVKTGRHYLQQYITVLTFRDGQISHWKDYWNPVNVANAIGGSDSSS